MSSTPALELHPGRLLPAGCAATLAAWALHLGGRDAPVTRTLVVDRANVLQRSA
jgi:hypothetical protein